METVIWGVWFKDHIHTDRYGQLALFCNRPTAEQWMATYAIPGCRLARLAGKMEVRPPRKSKSK